MEERVEKEIKEESKDKLKRRRNNIIGLIVIIFLILALIILLLRLRTRTQIIGKASGPIQNQEIKLENSYMFASPLRAKADGQERIRISIFALDSEGRGIVGKKAGIRKIEDVNIFEMQPITDSVGKAIYDLTSQIAGTYSVRGVIEGGNIDQTLNVTFE